MNTVGEKWPRAKHIATMALGALVTVGPQLIPSIPQQYKDLATAILAVATAAYHLYQPPPP